MSSARATRIAPRRSFTDSDIPRQISSIDPRERNYDTASDQRLAHDYFFGSTKGLSDSSSGTPPPLPLRPPAPSNANIVDESVESKKQKAQMWTQFRSKWKLSHRCPKTAERTKDTLEPVGEMETSQVDFVRARTDKTQGFKGFRRFSRQYMMSGALPNDNKEPASSLSRSADQTTCEDRDVPGQQHPLQLRRSSFDSNFRADSVLHANGYEAFSDTLSRRAIHRLSHFDTPPMSITGIEMRPFRHLTEPLDTEYRLKRAKVSAIMEGDTFGEPEPGLGNSIATKLPTEVLHIVYSYLGPVDLNAARHTCLTWMSASLQLELLTEHLKRGGWWSAASMQPLLFQEWRQAWPMSCYLARECALAGNWSGQGLSSGVGSVPNPMKHRASVDFNLLSEIGVEPATHSVRCGDVCTTSLCGRYYLTASGSDIYTYEIQGHFLRLLNKTSCERQVSAVSIDVSPERFAIAALLEGRVGLYIDMLGKSPPIPHSSPWENAAALDNAASDTAPIMEFGEHDGAGASEVPVGDFDELSLNAESVGSNNILHHSVEIVTQRTWAEFLHGSRARLRGMRQMPTSANGVWPQALHFAGSDDGNQKAKWLPQIVYRNVCTDEDPPCSVAISPTRQCVAFGCKAGVELYWVCNEYLRWCRFVSG